MRLWLCIFVLAAAIGLGMIMRQDPGYAFFAFRGWTVEMPLWVSVIIFIAAIALFLFVLWTVQSVFSSAGKVKYWWQHHKEHTARLQTYQGLLELAAGRFQKAERYLSKSAHHSDNPTINYLTAANAAEEGGAPERRDHYLQLALEASPDSDAVRLTQARLQLKHGELEQSLTNLKNLYEEFPKNSNVLTLLCTLYEAQEDYKSLYDLLPALKKNAVLPKAVLEKIEQKVYPALLNYYGENEPNKLRDFWNKVPPALKLLPNCIGTYVTMLIKNSEMDEAESVLRTSLKKTWDENLIKLYGLAVSKNPKKQLIYAESLLLNHSDSSILLLTLGRLCLRNQLWGKARDFLEQSLLLNPLPETYAELGQLMDHLGHIEKRDGYFREGLLAATKVVDFSDNPVHKSYEDA